ncbi:MAG: hypothetical protein K0U98_06365 [Deltaproteobacteria bacterium]|nr:hypothetical protein [Deltaproteobacteria bacterium]
MIATAAAAADGSYAVVWESGGQDGSLDGVFLRRFAANGAPLGDEQRVNTETLEDQRDADIAMLASGGFVVVWDSDLQDGSQRGIYGQLFDAAGAPNGDEFIVNLTTDGDQNDAVVAAAAAGGFVVAWETHPTASQFEDIVLRLFDAAAQPMTGEIAVNTTTAGDQEDIDIAADSSGNFVVAWESDSQDGSGEGIVARLFDNVGQPLGGEISVNTSTMGNQEDLDLAVRPDGSFLLVWEDDFQNAEVPACYGRFFDPEGTPVTGEFHIDAGVGGDFAPRAAFGPSGGAVVVWDSLGQDDSDSAVLARHFDQLGVPRGEAQLINTVTAGDQILAHLAIGTTASGLAVWISGDTPEGDSPGLFGRLFDLPLLWDGFESGDTSAWPLTFP